MGNNLTNFLISFFADAYVLQDYKGVTSMNFNYQLCIQL